MFPEIPVEFLQEKEVFKEFIYRINTLGRPGPCGCVTLTCLLGAGAVVGSAFFYPVKSRGRTQSRAYIP